MYNCVQCHVCRTPKEKLQFVVKCCIKKCSRIYCIPCIHHYYDTSFEISQYKKQTYICYNCQGKCDEQCIGCKKDQANSAERRANRKKNKFQSKNNQESMEHVSNMSASKPQEPAQNSTPEEEKEKDFIKDYRNVHDKMVIPNDEIIMMPFFMQRIAKRKNMFYDYMKNRQNRDNKHDQKERIKDLLEGALNSDKYKNDQLDQFDEIQMVSD